MTEKCCKLLGRWVPPPFWIAAALWCSLFCLLPPPAAANLRTRTTFISCRPRRHSLNPSDLDTKASLTWYTFCDILALCCSPCGSRGSLCHLGHPTFAPSAPANFLAGGQKHPLVWLLHLFFFFKFIWITKSPVNCLSSVTALCLSQ